MIRLPRRSLLAATGGLALPRLASAQGDTKVVMASWGGGGARMWREIYGTRFTAETGIPLTVAEVPDPTAAIAAAQGRPPYNLIVAAAFQAANLAKMGLLEDFSVEEIPEIRQVPENYWVKTPAGRIVGMPVYFIYHGVAFNTDLAKRGDFAQWRNIADARWRGQLSMVRPQFLATYELPLFAKIAGGDERNIDPGIPLLEGLARNAVTYYTSMPVLQTQLARGDVTAVPFYSSQVQLMKAGGIGNVDLVIPDEGGLAIPYLLVVPKNGPTPEAARRFMRMACDAASQVAAGRFAYFPMHKDAVLTPELERDLGMSVAEVRRRTWSPDWYVVGDKQQERTRLVERIVDNAR